MSIDVGAVTGTQSSLYTNSTSSTAAKQSLDSESFMTLLVAQLKYQDPSSPMSTNEMMTQTTQLASMEQLTKLSTTMSESFALQMRSSAAALVGQEVSYMTTEGDLITGIVDSVLYAGEVPTVIIGDTEIPLDAVAKVTTPGGAGGSAPEGAEGADGTAPGLDEADGPAPDGSIAA